MNSTMNDHRTNTTDNKWRNRLSAAAAISIIVLTITVATARQSVAQSGATLVRVVNTLRDPVPVRPITPVVVPFQASATGVFGSGSVAASGIIAVPDGKRLHIEFVSARAILPTGQNLCQSDVATIVDGSTVQHVLARVSQGAFFSGTDDSFAVSQKVDLYADGGTGVIFSLARNQATGTGNAYVTVAGYLTDAP